MDSSQRGVVDASSAPTGRAKTAETMDSSQGVTVDAPLVPAGRTESDPGAAAAFDTDQRCGEDPPTVLSGRASHEISSCGQVPVTVTGRVREQSQHLDGDPA